jgi:acetyl-CoA hydrolase
MLKKLAHPEDLIKHFPDGAYIGWSGFTGVGYPKYVPISSLYLQQLSLSCPSSRHFRAASIAHSLPFCRKIPTMLADHVEKNSLQGKLKYSLFVGASSGAETENRWAALNMIERRAPHQVGKAIAKGINNGDIKFFDKHLSMFPSDLVYVSATVS